MPEFSEVRGQKNLVRALQIAAAGGHHLLAYGPPGSGKTLALGRFPALLPLLDGETAVTVTRIHSLAGFPDETIHREESSNTSGEKRKPSKEGIPGNRNTGESCLLSNPPFREPHPNASLEGIAGGGRLLRPGEISLAHGGVLFLDEVGQFKASVLQALRAPLETGTVCLSRAGRTARFPARFQLLMAMNPCPCGNFAAKNRICTCAPDAVEKYWKKLGAPLLDRIDLRVHVENPQSGELTGTMNNKEKADTGDNEQYTQVAEDRLPPRINNKTTAELRVAVARAREIQWRRNRRTGRIYNGMEWLNARLEPGDIEKHCALSNVELETFSREMRNSVFSGRGGHGVLKVARTIADMEGSDVIHAVHIAEAASFRKWGTSAPDFLLDG